MDLYEAEKLALTEMSKHGLIAQGWTFGFDRAVQRFGQCNYTHRRITISGPLASKNDVKHVLNTIRHEIAHALAGNAAGHGYAWQVIARRIGGNGERTADARKLVLPVPKLIATCPGCGTNSFRNRRTSTLVACSRCCRKHNHGKFDHKYILSYRPNTKELTS